MPYAKKEYGNFSVELIPCFSDNYSYAVTCKKTGALAIVDPGDSDPVFRYLRETEKKPSKILVTHSHSDHIAGIEALIGQFADCAVYGPARQSGAIPELRHAVEEGGKVMVGEVEFNVWDTSGHSMGDLTYQNTEALFCGDTVFMCGIGRVFSGDYAAMQKSVCEKIATFDEKTDLYCGHEYTLSNMKFALEVDPANQTLKKAHQSVLEKILNKLPSLPSNIGLEKQINPFFRHSKAEIIHSLENQFGRKIKNSLEAFTLLRNWKDRF